MYKQKYGILVKQGKRQTMPFQALSRSGSEFLVLVVYTLSIMDFRGKFIDLLTCHLWAISELDRNLQQMYRWYEFGNPTSKL